MNELELVRYNVAIEPSEEVREAAITLSKELSGKSPVYFTLDGENYFPHITVYSPAYPVYNKEKVMQEVEDIAKNFTRFSCAFAGVQLGEKYIGIDILHSFNVSQLHDTVVQRLNPLRDGLVRKKFAEDGEEFLTLSEERKAYARKYGAADVMSLYRPHLTITRFVQEGVAEQFATDIRWSLQNFMASELSVYEMGENGTCIKLVKRFALKEA